MGLVLDSSVLITAERKGESVGDLLRRLFVSLGDQEMAMSAVSVVELGHGIYRAIRPEMRNRRQAFLDDLLGSVPTYPLTVEIALLAARIDAEQRERGIRIPFPDLLIGATALHLGFDVITENARDFERIPGLVVRTL